MNARKTLQEKWNAISNIGVTNQIHLTDSRQVILNNRLNFVILIVMLCMLVLNSYTKKQINIGFIKIALVIGISILNLYLSKKGKFNISKLFTCTLPITFLLFIPLLKNHVTDEFFFWYAYAIICSSVLPHLLFSFKRKDIYYYISTMLYCFLLLIFSEFILEKSMIRPLAIVPIIHDNIIFFKATQIAIYVIINLAFIYTIRLNIYFEEKLLMVNIQLEEQNFEIQAQSEELTATNEELQSSNEELRSASEEVQQSYEHLAKVNNELDLHKNNLELLIQQRSKDLFRSETKYRELFENAHDAIFLMRNECIVSCNLKTEELFGCGKDLIIGETPYRFSPINQPDGQNSKEKAIQKIKLVLQGTPQRFEWQHCQYNHSIFDVDVSLNSIDLLGETFIQAIVRDVTERNKMVTALRDSEERYRTVVSNSPMVTFVTDEKGIFTLSEGMGLVKLGLKPGQVVGLSVFDVYHDFPFIVDAMKNALAGQTIRNEFIVQEIVFDVLFFPIMNDQGKVVKVIGVSNDITERKQAEKTSQENQTMLKQVIDAIPQSVFWKTKESIYLGCNNVFAKAIGLNNSDDIIGKTDYDLPWKKEDIINYISDDQYVVTNKTPKTHIVEPLQQSDGSRLWVDTSKIPLVNKKDEVYGLLGIYEDITERLRILNVLEKNKFLLEKAQSIAKIGHWEIDLNTNIIFGSPEALEIYGIQKSESLLSEIQKSPLPEYRKLLDQSLTGLVTLGIKYDIEFKIQRSSDGKIIDIHSIAEFNKKENRVFGIIQDISEHKQVEEALQQSVLAYNLEKEKAETYLNLAEVILVAFDKNTKITLLNRKGYQVLGYELGSLQDMDWFRICLPPEEYETTITVYNQLIAGDAIPFDYFENNIITKKGETRLIAWHNTLVKDSSGSIIGTLSSGEDITERRLAEQALFNSEQRLKNLVEATFEGIVFSENGIIFDINDQICNMLGTDRLNIISRPVFDFIAPESVEKVSSIIKEKKIDPYEFIAQKEDGTQFFAEARIQIINIDTRQIRVAAIRDITEKKESERRILNAIIEAEERERNHFSRELHDGLGPTLSTVKLYFQWLSETTDEKKRKIIIEKGNRNFDDAMITLKEISNNLSPRVLNSLGIVPAIRNFIQRLTDLKKLNIDFDFNTECRFDKNIEITIYRIASELINNTIKYATAKDIYIKLNYDSDIQKLKLLYIDNGVGFDLHAVLSSKKGLGLTNIHQRVNTLNGNINIESSLGNGIKVEIELPLTEKN